MNERSGAADDPARAIAGLFAEFDRHRRVLGQRATLGTADMRLLWLFTDGHPRTLRDIAEALTLEQSTVNRQVNAAVKAGFLVREREGGSGPYRFLASPAGVQEFEHNLKMSLDAYRAGLAELGAGSAEFLEMLAVYVDAYRDAVERP